MKLPKDFSYIIVLISRNKQILIISPKKFKLIPKLLTESMLCLEQRSFWER